MRPGGQVKITADGVNADGKPMHSEWTGKFDGKDYPVTGDPNADMRSYTKVDDRTLNFTGKKGGKVTVTGRVVVAADGKSRTVTRVEQPATEPVAAPGREAIFSRTEGPRSSKTSRSTTSSKATRSVSRWLLLARRNA